MDFLKKLSGKIKSLFSKRRKPEAGEEAPKKEPAKWVFWAKKTVWTIFLVGVLTCFFVVMAFGWYSFIYLDDEFDLSMVDSSLNYTSVVYALDDGAYVEAETLHASENRIWTDIENIPDQLQQAFVSIEDERFYKHSGVDIKRTLHAVLNFFNPSSDSSFGGSTITQQVIKNLSGDSEQTVTRKVQEIRRAWYLEREYKKDQILEVYLNTIYLSQGCYGVETAAETYFGKTVDQLTLLECASIASITKLPTYYDPVQNPENNLKRAHTVLDKMAELGYITTEEAAAAKEQELKLYTGESIKTNESGTAVNSYFVDQVILDVIKALVNEKGYSQSYAHSLVYSGGIQIYSTMELDVQAAVDKVYKDRSNFPNITSGGQKPQSAIVVINNETGAIAGMAGGVGEKTTARGLNRATQSFLQPGSCMKPIGTYAPAIEYGATIDGVRVAPGLMVQDKGVRQQSNGNWWPKNYDGAGSEKFMTVQAAVDRSTNTVAVRVNHALGASASFNFLKNNLGVSTLIAGSGYDENDQAMALGGLTKGISVMEITAAYSAFPNQGTYTTPYTFTKICDQNGRVILENRVESHTAMKENTAAVMNQMLEHACTFGTGTVAKFSGTAVAGKTGTTDDDKDRWFVGYTKYYSAGVWFGYDQPATVRWSGVNPAARTFKNVMSAIHSGLAYKSFAPAAGLVNASACVESGKVPGEKCPDAAAGLYFAGSVPSAPCDICGQPDPNAPPAQTPPTTPQTPVTPPAPTVPDTPTTPDTPTPPDTPVTPDDPSGSESETPDPPGDKPDDNSCETTDPPPDEGTQTET